MSDDVSTGVDDEKGRSAVDWIMSVSYRSLKCLNTVCSAVKGASLTRIDCKATDE